MRISSALMRSSMVSLAVAVVLAAGPPAALAQDSGISEAASNVPPTLFEPASDSLPRRTAAGDSAGASFVLAGILLAGAAAAGYFTGSSRRTRRS
jgi:hypothetical protein